jgi:hypothetical protein
LENLIKTKFGAAFANYPSMRKFLLLAFSLNAFFFIHLVQAQTYTMEHMHNLKNDKEVILRAFSKKEQARISQIFTDIKLNDQVTQIFYKTVLDLINKEDRQCELKLIENFQNALKQNGLETDREGMLNYIKMMRVEHKIDDILFRILNESLEDFYQFDLLDTERGQRNRLFKRKKVIAANDIQKLFSGFEQWPDDKTRCTYQEFFYIKGHVKKTKDKESKSSQDLKTLINEALKAKIINLETYNKLLYLENKSNIDSLDLWLEEYLRVILQAKNKMVPKSSTYGVKKIEEENDYSSERSKRFSKITRRRLLYRKYNETQIILLSQVLQKASRRMGVDPDTISGAPTITQEFNTLQENGQRETYVERIELDQQSQYTLARRRLRKDVVELQMMDIFYKIPITHEDIVMAALETGYITHEDLEFVVKYDDLWNPHKSDFEKISGFIFSAVGYSSFLLPPPWNITAAIAIGVVEGLFNNKHKKGTSNDNPATFIE